MNFLMFSALNAGSSPSPLVVSLALFFSKYAPYCLMAYCGVAFVFGNARLRATLFVTVIAALVAAAISWLLGRYAYSPRPFVDSVGHVLLEHKDNASFPSNHMMFMMIFAASFLQGRYIKTGLAFFALALAIGWSRIYLGVHYPVDIAGGALIGVGTAICVGRILRPRANSIFGL
ncbi:MAG: phosphatase PAP2 family protein [Pigmentiphaga sp.]|nr:phosphatase PAP2 family protein [Pigmentiphaga sp.]